MHQEFLCKLEYGCLTGLSMQRAGTELELCHIRRAYLNQTTGKLTSAGNNLRHPNLSAHGLVLSDVCCCPAQASWPRPNIPHVASVVIFTKLFILFELVMLITILLKLGYLFSIVFKSPKLNII